MNEGIKRLAILIGTFCMLFWLILIAVVSDGFTGFRTFASWMIFLVGLPLSFLVPFRVVFELIHGIVWVIRGFRTRPPR